MTTLGIGRKIREAYKNICALWTQHNDEIYLVGFSRGAYTAQCVARLIHDIGLLESSYVDQELRELFRLWKSCKGDPNSPSSKLLQDRLDLLSSSASPKIRGPNNGIQIVALALWDNVASLRKGIFSKKSDFDFVGEKLPPNVTHCFHAMALDELRKDFPITMLTSSEPQRLTQTWFRGSHSDVGGGNENLGLANISLCWMLCALQNNLHFDSSVAWEQTEKGAVLEFVETRMTLRYEPHNKFNSR